VAEELFDIYFSGKLMPNCDEQEARDGVARLFKANEKTLAQLFSGQSVKIKKSVDMDTAIKYRVKFREIGAIIDIRPVGAAAPQTPPQSAPAKPAVQTQPQPATPPPVSEAPAPQQAPSAITSDLAPVGSQIDETPEPEPARIDTDSLSAAPANSGSLEDYAEPVIPAELPDISDLAFGPDDEPLDNTPAPPALEVDTSDLLIDQFSDQLDESMPPPPADIDTSSLSVSEANTGSLEEYNSRPEPVPLPDISNLKIED